MSPPYDLGSGAAQRVTRARLDLNESAFPPLPAVVAALRATAVQAHRYPEFLPDGTRHLIADHLGLLDEQVTVGAGATGVALLGLQSAGRRAHARGVAAPTMVTATPTFDGYPILADMLGMPVVSVPLLPDGDVDLTGMLDAITTETAVVVLCSPHNPTGAVIGESDLTAFLDAVPSDVWVLLDQAYIEFCDDPPDLDGIITDRPDVVVVRTFSKAYGLAALRIGYGVGTPRIIDDIRRYEVPFAISPAAAAALPVALAADDELRQRVRQTRGERVRLARLLAEIGAPTLAGQGNFLFVPGADGLALGRLLRTCDVLTKECGTYGLRITIGDRSCTDRILATLRTTALTV